MPISRKTTRQVVNGRLQLDISNQCTGTNQNFVIPAFQKGSLMVFYNGMLQRVGNEITVLSNARFRTNFFPESNDTLHVIFFRA